jgi:hypothetical protein
VTYQNGAPFAMNIMMDNTCYWKARNTGDRLNKTNKGIQRDLGMVIPNLVNMNKVKRPFIALSRQKMTLIPVS